LFRTYSTYYTFGEKFANFNEFYNGYERNNYGLISHCVKLRLSILNKEHDDDDDYDYDYERFRDIITCLAHMTACELEQSFN